MFYYSTVILIRTGHLILNSKLGYTKIIKSYHPNLKHPYKVLPNKSNEIFNTKMVIYLIGKLILALRLSFIYIFALTRVCNFQERIQNWVYRYQILGEVGTIILLQETYIILNC